MGGGGGGGGGGGEREGGGGEEGLFMSGWRRRMMMGSKRCRRGKESDGVEMLGDQCSRGEGESDFFSSA